MSQLTIQHSTGIHIQFAVGLILQMSSNICLFINSHIFFTTNKSKSVAAGMYTLALDGIIYVF